MKLSPTTGTIEVPTSLVRNAIEALKYKAHDEAGQSQYPELFSAEETQDWYVASVLEDLLKRE